MNIFVSGSNKGIGKEIIKIISQRNDVKQIYAGTRNLDNIKWIYDNEIYNEQINKIYPIEFDLNQSQCDQQLFKNLQQQKLNVVINNAAINKNKEQNIQEVKDIIYTNFLNTVQFTENILSKNYLQKNSLILNVGSMYGTLRGIQNINIKNQLYKAKCKQELIDLAIQYINEWPNNYYLKFWPCKAYSFSKVLLYFYTKLLAQDKIYCVHPKWVKTDMGGSKAPLNAYQGAQNILKPLDFKKQIDNNLQGKMLCNGNIDLENELILQLYLIIYIQIKVLNNIKINYQNLETILKLKKIYFIICFKEKLKINVHLLILKLKRMKVLIHLQIINQQDYLIKRK